MIISILQPYAFISYKLYDGSDNSLGGCEQFHQPCLLLDLYLFGEDDVELDQEVTSRFVLVVMGHPSFFDNPLGLGRNYLVELQLDDLAVQLFLSYWVLTTWIDLESSASTSDILAVYIRSSGSSESRLYPISGTSMIWNTKLEGLSPGCWFPCPLKTIGHFYDAPALMSIVLVS